MSNILKYYVLFFWYYNMQINQYFYKYQVRDTYDPASKDFYTARSKLALMYDLQPNIYTVKYSTTR